MTHPAAFKLEFRPETYWDTTAPIKASTEDRKAIAVRSSRQDARIHYKVVEEYEAGLR